MYQINRVLFINHSGKKLKEHCSCRTWNKDDDVFDQQLRKWVVEKKSDQIEPVKR